MTFFPYRIIRFFVFISCCSHRKRAFFSSISTLYRSPDVVLFVYTSLFSSSAFPTYILSGETEYVPVWSFSWGCSPLKVWLDFGKAIEPFIHVCHLMLLPQTRTMRLSHSAPRILISLMYPLKKGWNRRLRHFSPVWKPHMYKKNMY